MLRWDEVVACFVLKALELTARKMLRWKVVSERVTRYDAAQDAATARLQSTVEYYRKVLDEGDKKDKAGSSGSSGKGGSPAKPRRKFKGRE